MPEALLTVADLHAWYGESHVLHGIEFAVRPAVGRWLERWHV